MVEASQSAQPEADASARVQSLVGQTLGGRYRISSVIGTGGMGAVYRARHLQLDKTVAIKVLHAEMTAHREVVLRFEREAMVSAKIQHPHVVNATDSGRLSDGSLYLVLEYVSGRSLREVLEEAGSLSPGRVCRIGAQVAQALGAAHRADIIHRDLKPANVMLVSEGGSSEFVKVLDFGIAKVLGPAASSEPLTRSGSVFGTPEYMSPEQARGEVVDHRADLYALGVMLHELLAGRPPFEAPELVAVLFKHVTEAPPELPERVPAALRRLVAALLDKAPERRPESADEVARALSEAIPRAVDTLPPAAPAGPQPTPVAPSASRSVGARRLALRSLRGLGVAARAAAVATQAGGRGAWTGLAWLGRKLLPWLGWAGRGLRRGSREVLDRASRELARHVPPALEPHARLLTVAAATFVAASALALVVWTRPRVDELLLARAAQGDALALSELSEVDPDERSGRTWLVLWRGLSARERHEEALSALLRAIDVEPSLAEEADVASALRRAADLPGTSERALELAAQRLDELGADLLFDVWSATGAKTPATRRARKWLDTESVRDEASPALSIALDLREARGCEAVKALLSRVRDAGDERCLHPLRRFEERQGCGLLELEDCFSCLRSDEALERAIEAVGERPAPRF